MKEINPEGYRDIIGTHEDYFRRGVECGRLWATTMVHPSQVGGRWPEGPLVCEGNRYETPIRWEWYTEARRQWRIGFIRGLNQRAAELHLEVPQLPEDRWVKRPL
jgi:hypothetical protein